MGESRGQKRASIATYSNRGNECLREEDNQGEESGILSPRGRKRTAFEDPETKVSKREKKSPPEAPTAEGVLAAQCPREDQHSNEL